MPRLDSKGDLVYPTPIQNTVAARDILSNNPGPEQVRLGIKLLTKGLEQQMVAKSGSGKLVSKSDQCHTDSAWNDIRPQRVPEQRHRSDQREDNYSRTGSSGQHHKTARDWSNIVPAAEQDAIAALYPRNPPRRESNDRRGEDKEKRREEDHQKMPPPRHASRPAEPAGGSS